MLRHLIVVGALLMYSVEAESRSWKFANNSDATNLVGVGVESDTRAVAGAALDGIGGVLKRYDGEEWKEVVSDGAGLLMDAAVGSKYTVATSIFPILVSDNDGESCNTVDSLGGASQSAHVSSTGVISLVGSFLIPTTQNNDSNMGVATTNKPTHAYGVARSTDGGNSWNVSSIAEGYCRYGSFPSEKVWYVTNGMWGSDPTAPLSARVYPHSFNANRAMDNAARSLQPYPLSSRVTMGGIASTGGMQFHLHERTAREVARLRRQRRHGISITSNDNSGATAGFNSALTDATTGSATDSGWFGSISKTMDGGKSWKTVFTSDPKSDFYYFNSISCSSESHCVAVAEGDDTETGGSIIRAYVTFDGGETWSNTLAANEVVDTDVVSIMAASWVSETEGWLGATMVQQIEAEETASISDPFRVTTTNSKTHQHLMGVFYHTINGGKTYTVGQLLPDCFVMDMDFGNEVGFASCVSSSGLSSRVAMYI